MFGSIGVELGVVLELEQEFEVAADAQFFHQASPGGDLHALGAAGVAAAAVGPVQRPKALAGRALLDEQLASTIENKQGESPMQHPTTLVAQRFAQVPEPPILLVDENQRVRICHVVPIVSIRS
jgi:hypothetical protein